MGKKQDKQALTASQLSTTLAGLSSMFAPPNTGQGRYAAYLMDSGQGMTQAQAQYMAEKKAKEEAKKKGLGGMLGTAGALVAAPFTGGASLALAPALSQVGSGITSGDMGSVAGGLASGAGQFAGGGLTGAATDMAGGAINAATGQGAPDPMYGVGVEKTKLASPQFSTASNSSATPSADMYFDSVTGTWKKKGATQMYDPMKGLY